MPISHKIDVDKNLVITKMSGLITDEESRINMSTIAANPHFVPERNHVIDMLGVTESRISTERVDECASNTPFSPGSVRVFVALDQKELNLAHLYIWLTKNKLENFHVVETMDEANMVLSGNLQNPQSSHS